MLTKVLVVLTLSLGLSGAWFAGTASAPKSAACCAPGAACCVPGSACCEAK